MKNVAVEDWVLIRAFWRRFNACLRETEELPALVPYEDVAPLDAERGDRVVCVIHAPPPVQALKRELRQLRLFEIELRRRTTLTDHERARLYSSQFRQAMLDREYQRRLTGVIHRGIVGHRFDPGKRCEYIWEGWDILCVERGVATDDVRHRRGEGS